MVERHQSSTAFHFDRRGFLGRNTAGPAAIRDSGLEAIPVLPGVRLGGMVSNGNHKERRRLRSPYSTVMALSSNFDRVGLFTIVHTRLDWQARRALVWLRSSGRFGHFKYLGRQRIL